MNKPSFILNIILRLSLIIIYFKILYIMKTFFNNRIINSFAVVIIIYKIILTYLIN